MARDVVEVVARFAGTLIQVARVGPSQTYRIGTAPNVDLAVEGYTSYPLVDGGMVRVPFEVVAARQGRTMSLQLGQVTVELTRMAAVRSRLPRRRVEWRTPLFIAASLLIHLGVWLAAITTEPFERATVQQRRLRFVHAAHTSKPMPEQVPQLQHKREQIKREVQPRGAGSALVQLGRESRVGRRAAAVREQTEATMMSVADAVARATNSADVASYLEKLSAEDNFSEDELEAQGFGGGRRMGSGETVKTGTYSTMAFDVKLCPDRACTVRGPIPALYIRTHLHAVMPAIYECYIEHAEAAGTIVLEFTVTIDGAVRNAKGSGLGETGACAARVASQLYFKALGKDARPGQPTETHVRYPLRFN